MNLRTRTARKHLDGRLAHVREVAREPRPPQGWIRAIRESLGMSTAELARRMGVVQSRVSSIEQAEARGTIRLDTLERAARALECELAYFIVPRTTLDLMAREQARRKAEASLRSISHQMRLEDQESDTGDSVEELADRLIDRRGLWTDEPTT